MPKGYNLGSTGTDHSETGKEELLGFPLFVSVEFTVYWWYRAALRKPKPSAILDFLTGGVKTWVHCT
jgi:hypothetical protein